MNGQGIPCGCNSYSFIPILSKLHWWCSHGLKICIRLRYNPQIIFATFLQVELSHFSGINKVNGQGKLVGATAPTVLYDSFETSLVFWSWSENMHVVWV